MPLRTRPPQPVTPNKRLIVEVEGYEGEDGAILVVNARAPRMGVRDKLYCIAQLYDDGVVRIDDWGYATAWEAREALEGAERARLHARNRESAPNRPPNAP